MTQASGRKHTFHFGLSCSCSDLGLLGLAARPPSFPPLGTGYCVSILYPSCVRQCCPAWSRGLIHLLTPLSFFLSAWDASVLMGKLRHLYTGPGMVLEISMVLVSSSSPLDRNPTPKFTLEEDGQPETTPDIGCPQELVWAGWSVGQGCPVQSPSCNTIRGMKLEQE